MLGYGWKKSFLTAADRMNYMLRRARGPSRVVESRNGVVAGSEGIAS
jgi:hypothetical protein